MVRHLQHVQRPSVARYPGSQQLRVDLLFDIPCEHEPAAAESDIEHDRHVVDARACVSWAERDASREWPVDVHAHSVEPHHVAGGYHATFAAQVHHATAIGRVTGTGPDHARLHDLRYAIAVQDRRESGHVIFVRVREHHEIEPTIPGRDALVEQRDEPVRIGARVDEGATTVGSLEQDRIALADIQNRHVQSAVRACPDRGKDQDARGCRSSAREREAGTSTRRLFAFDLRRRRAGK